ncbi:translational activator of GCN4 [Neurospora sp. IMI 360204]|nr:translational activator of GCN4 [Neurospora sp. IMI 360204]
MSEDAASPAASTPNNAPADFDLVAAKAALTSSSTTARISQLRSIEEKLSQKSLDRPTTLGVLKVLFWTHDFYHDRPSRTAVQKCLVALAQNGEPEILTPLVAAIGQEIKKGAIAPGSTFTLVEWSSLLVQNCAGTPLWDKFGKDLTLSLAEALEKCCQPSSRGTVSKSALVITRRALRKLVAGDDREKAIEEAVKVLAAKGTQSTAKYAVLLGVIAGVCSRKPEAVPIIEKLKSQYFTFYTREIVGSRTQVPTHQAAALSDFFSSFVTLEDLDKEVFPSLEKGLLRAPEVVLNDLITPLVGALPQDLDLSAALNGRFVKPLLNNIKSSNAVIRSGAVTVFKGLAARSKDSALLEKVADEVLNPLKTGKLASADHRVLHSEMLVALVVSTDIASKIANGLPLVTGKEGNEAALSAETVALNASAVYLLNADAEIPKPLADAYVKGLGEKKLPVRRTWILRAGDILYAFNKETLPANFIKFAEALVAPLGTTFAEVVANPATAAQNGIVTGALVLCTVESLIRRAESSTFEAVYKKANIQKNSLAITPKPSYLFNPRIYGKFADEDLKWLTRALTAVAPFLGGIGLPERVAWAQAFIYVISSATTGPEVRRDAIDTLSTLYAQSSAKAEGPSSLLTETIVEGLWHWIEATEAADKESAAALAKSGTSNLHFVLRAICLKPEEYQRRAGAEPDKTKLESQMCSLLVLAKSQLIPRASWIDLCLKVETDPGELARKYEQRLLDEIVNRTLYEQKSETVRLAAYSAAAELVFVALETMTPRIVDLIQQNLNVSEVQSVGPLEAAIFRTPEGTAFVDVLAKKQNVVPNKNDPNYHTLKWEEELREQIAQKKGVQRKLTAEENAKVNAQLKKEAEIRESVRHVAANLLRGFGIVKALATGPPTDASRWMGPAVKATLSVINAGATLITGEAGPLAFISCSECVTSRVGPIRPFIGVATLRAHNVSALPENLTEEPFEDLITRALYRLRFAGEQRPFDVISLIYILPLLLLVLEKGGFGPNADDKDATLVLAIEFLSFHTDVYADEATPRAEILSTLITSMQNYNQHYKIIKDCFSDMVRCIAPNISAEEIAVLSRGAIVPQVAVRTAALQAISSDVDMSELDISEEIWLACHDDVPENADLGRDIWEESEFHITEELAFKMLPYLESKDGQLRRAAAKGLAEALEQNPSAVNPVIEKLRESYAELAKPRLPELDEFGMPKKKDLSDPWEARQGLALAFQGIAPLLQKNQLEPFFAFLIDNGPLGDQNGNVRAQMLDAANTAIEIHGKSILDKLMKTFEKTLEAPDKGTAFADRVNEAVIIMYGALARHLKHGDAKIPVVIDRLIATLSTPSETVQYAIAECLPPLVRTCGDKSSKYIEQVIETLMASKDYAVQRGAAYGLAGLILGRGVNSLKEHRILITLRSALENKKEVNQRESAMIALELLSTILGRLFEPYVIQIVPQLLAGFGDSNPNVREAALAAAKSCFAKLSSFGVKKILPTLLDGLDEDQWRSKKGACDLLGAMAYLDPQQLAQSLPEIIPPLTAVLNDSHKEVRLAANKSLKRFGEVIENPEIHNLVDILLKALSDPTKYTDEALDSLIKVQFVHYLDAPSLALVSRILQRGLGDRSNTKRKAAQVIGSLAHLTERKDLVAHLPVLVAGLKIAIVDPVPTTRATASRALGSLVEKLGEDALPDLIPGLMQTLKSDTGAGDRLGSAQALSEVLAGLGTSRLEETLPTILQNVDSSKPAVREGFMSLFIFLPVCFGNSFANYLAKIIPPILSGLADDVETIRETALRAGRLLVKNFAVRAVDLLLPELERGLADDSYRIRLSSVELVGDLLFNLTGVKVSDGEDEEEDLETVKEAGASLREILGEEKRNKVLSSLYICRCDTSGAVRSAAVSVWKALVHSPRILKELVPTLTQLIIRRLGSSNMEHKIIASNALGELIRKAGDGVLATLLPTLEEGLQTSSDVDARQGICLALKELIASASPEALEDHEKTLISVVRTALTDRDEDVREAAAEAFDSLQQILGKRAVEEVMPFLLTLLANEEEAENALAALLTLLTETTRSNMILPNLIPSLIKPPISSFNAKALASLSKVAGAAMNRRLPSIINSLMDNIINSTDDTLREELDDSFDTVILSIDEYDGLNMVMQTLLQLLKHDDHRRRASTAFHLAKFFASADVDYSRYNQDIIRSLLLSFDDRDMDVVKSAWSALSEFTKKLKKEDMENLVISTRQTLLQVGITGVNLRGFELPKGINAILPIFLQGLMNGSADQRVASALAISDIVDRTSEASLKPFVTQITGPLIRVVSERSTEVKSAILLTLNNLLEKMPTALKPFLPQLQRTFAKSLADTSSDVLRSRAAKALGTLIKFTPRVDPLIAELVTGSKTSDVGVKTAMLKALYEVISKAGANMGESSRTAVLGLIDTEADERDDTMTITYAKLFGALVKNVSDEVAAQLLKNRVLTRDFSNSSVLALNAVLLESPEALLESSLVDDLPELLCQGMASKNAFITENFILATGKFLLSPAPKSFEATKPLFATISTLIPPGQPTDSRRLALVLVRTLSRTNPDLVRPHLGLLAPPVFASVRDMVIPVKLAAEAAFVQLFAVADEENKVFDKYLEASQEMPANVKRSMQDYFKRVALRLGAQVRERREAEGGAGGLGLSNDEADDEKELMSVGRVDVAGGGEMFD